jgi:hypothetical protein
MPFLILVPLIRMFCIDGCDALCNQSTTPLSVLQFSVPIMQCSYFHETVLLCTSISYFGGGFLHVHQETLCRPSAISDFLLHVYRDNGSPIWNFRLPFSRWDFICVHQDTLSKMWLGKPTASGSEYRHSRQIVQSDFVLPYLTTWQTLQLTITNENVKYSIQQRNTPKQRWLSKFQESQYEAFWKVKQSASKKNTRKQNQADDIQTWAVFLLRPKQQLVTQQALPLITAKYF